MVVREVDGGEGGGGGEGGEGGGEGATQEILIVSHELAGPVMASSHVEFRLKRRSVEKHVSLRRRRCGSGPRGNVVVERRSGKKHSSHRSHFFCVPTPNVLVERRSGIKHTIHSSHLSLCSNSQCLG